MNLTLRPFAGSDAAAIASWVTDEHAMRLWSADRYKVFPLTGEDIRCSYEAESSADDFRPFTMLDGNVPVGHVVMVRPKGRPGAVRLVYTIVDPSRRGCGLGRRLLDLAVTQAFVSEDVGRVLIGVFESNESALRCYLSSGFVPTGERFEMNCGNAGKRPCVMLSVSRPDGRSA